MAHPEAQIIVQETRHPVVLPARPGAPALAPIRSPGAQLKLAAPSPLLSALDDAPDDLPEGTHPSVGNLLGMVHGWRSWPRSMDFLDPDSPNFWLQRLTRDLYLRLLEPALMDLEAGDAVLDLAAGPGRFAAPLLERGLEVDLVDGCRPSLEAALRHLAAVQGCPPSARFDLRWEDVRDLRRLPEGRYALVLAIELLCYLADPVAVLRQVRRCLRPGGLVALSVEAWPGALFAQGPPPIEHLAAAQQTRRIEVPGARWVQCYRRVDVETMIEAAGLTPVRVQGTHRCADGPLFHLLDLDRLSDTDYRSQVIAAEQRLESEPALEHLPRAWFALAQSPVSEGLPSETDWVAP